MGWLALPAVRSPGACGGVVGPGHAGVAATLAHNLLKLQYRRHRREGRLALRAAGDGRRGPGGHPAAAVGAAALTSGRRLAVGAVAAVASAWGCRGSANAKTEDAPAPGQLSAGAKALTDADKQYLSDMFNKAVSVKSVEEEEATWSAILGKYGAVPEVEARVVVNRGNSRARQGKLDAALSDYTRSIELAPGEVDAYLNRGAVYEALGRLGDAISDYDTGLSIDPRDPVLWNNRGNAMLGLGRYADARDSFKSALSISGPQQFAFAAVNLNLAEFELGNDDAVAKDLRSLLARYSEAFPDARAVYALLLWDRGDRVQAESEWDRATTADPRYKSLSWVTEFRRWPPRIRGILQRFSETTQVKVK